MLMRTRSLFGTLFVLVFLSTASASPAGAQAYVDASRAFVADLTGQAVAFLNQGGVTEAETKRRFQNLFKSAFAVRGIALFVLGRFSRSATDAERAEFVRLFEDVTVKTWSDRFVGFAQSGVTGNFFEITDAIAVRSPVPGQNAVVVRSVFRSGSSNIDVDWRIASANGVFKIIDVLVEGISLVNTQREEFASVLRQNNNDVSALNALLRARLNQG